MMKTKLKINDYANQNNDTGYRKQKLFLVL